MSQIAIVVDAPDYAPFGPTPEYIAAYVAPDFLGVGLETTRLVRGQLPIDDNVTLASVVVSHNDIIIDPDVTTSVIAGDEAGDLPLSGITTAAVIYSVTGIKIADQTTIDFTEEFGSKQDVVSNTGGSDTTDYTLVVVWR